MQATFHPATEFDIPVIRALSEVIWREHYPGIITPEQVEYMLDRTYSEAVLRKEIRDGVVYEIARLENRDAGYLSHHLEPDRWVKLSKLYLLRDYRGRGFGKSLLSRVAETTGSLGARGIYLYVNKRNVVAIAAYERFGFIRAESVITDIGGGFVMDDWVMRYPLL